MDSSPWLPALNSPGVTAFAEATTDGSKFVEIGRGRYDPLHSFAAGVASPYESGLVCKCGIKNPDGCVKGSSITGPFWNPPGPVRWEFASPFELLPGRTK